MTEQQDFFSGPPQTMFAFGFVAGIALAAILGFFFFGGVSTGTATRTATAPTAEVAAPTAAAPTAAARPTAAALPEVTDEDWVRGDLSKAKVVMVEYSDYECPFCSRHHPSMVQALEDYGDDVAWVYRHFPLSFHAQATPSAVASECVGELGGNDAFWDFTDAMFDNQTSLGTTLYEATVQDLGIDLADYQDCVTSGRHAGAVTADQAGGQAAGATGTPATFINGQLVSGAVPYAQLQAIVESAL